MLTSEKLLKIISVSIFFATVLFTLYVVVKELAKPKDILARIIKTDCDNSFSTLDKAIENETAIMEMKSDCIFVPSDLNDKSDLLKLIFAFGYLENFDFLFFGEKGILLKRTAGSFIKKASLISNCIRKNDCKSSSFPIEQATVTVVMQDRFGKAVISTTYKDTLISQIAINGNKLIREISSIKQINSENLRLLLMFHNSYAYLEDKTPQRVNSLMKKGVDGLLLESRGAKIRVLPWEYSDNPVAVADRKGKQYGLEKEEYIKEEASFFHYRTTQFIEQNGMMIPWAGSFSHKKSEYSDSFALRLISKHLKNIQFESGYFPAEIGISDGIELKKKESIYIQISAADALFKAFEILQQKEILNSALNSTKYIIEQNVRSDISDGFLLNLLNSCSKNCTDIIFNEKREELSTLFKDFSKVKNLIIENPVFTGIFLHAFYISSEKASVDLKISELIEISFEKYNKMNVEDKLRFLSYIPETGSFPGTDFSRIIGDFFISQSSFIKENRFSSNGFNEFRGIFKSSRKSDSPNTALSLLIASGLSSAMANNYSNQEITDMESSAGNFIRYLIVTEDDFPNWNSPESKEKVQGGVRAFTASDTIKLANSARALNYFVNRIKAGRAR